MKLTDILLKGGVFMVPYSAGALVMTSREWWMWVLLILAAMVTGVIVGLITERAERHAVAQFKSDMGYGQAMGGMVGGNHHL